MSVQFTIEFRETRSHERLVMAYLGKATIQYNDYDAERSTVQVNSAAVTAANHDAQVAALTSFVDAIAGITLGLKVGQGYGNFDQILDGQTKASNAFAQRESKWLVRYHDANQGWKLEIPCADLQFLDVNNRGYLDLDGTEGAAFKSAFEAFVLSPDGLATTVDSVQHVGRNI